MKKIIIIGAGIAGMAAGIYGQINGFETEIYESHTGPGGECTGWDRGEYHFDGCIHYLMGSKPDTALNRVWREVGALDDSIGIVNHDYFYRFEEAGQAVNIYRDVERLEQHLIQLAPEDADLIQEMGQAIRTLGKMEMPVAKPLDLYTPEDMAKIGDQLDPLLPYLEQYSAITIEEFARQFKSPLLQKAFMMPQMPNKYSALELLLILASLNGGDCGWPSGGSKKLAQRMATRYQSLGGNIFYRSKVKEIRISDGKAIGVILEDGSERCGDLVISAADGHFTLETLLGGAYWDESLERLYTDREAYPIYTTVQVSLGIACDLAGEPHLLDFKPTRAVNAGGTTCERISLKHFCYDPSMAPQGKSVITVLLDADYDWWVAKGAHREAYQAEKERIAAEVGSAVEARYPETKGKIEQVDVVTPLTYARYCNAWRGAWMSWMTTPKGTISYLPGNLEGLENFYMTGQWTMPPGGLAGAVITGKWTIQRICSQLGYEFKTTEQ